MVTEAEVLRTMRGKHYRPMKAAELARQVGVKPDEMRDFKQLLRQMELDGLIVEVKQSHLALPQKVDLVVGLLRVNPRGFGFVIPRGTEAGQDIYVAEGDMATAVDRDTVAVRLHRPQPREGPAGKVVSIVNRGRDRIVGTFQTSKRFSFCVPDDPSIVHNIYIHQHDSHNAKPGEKVVVEITEWPSRHSAPEGRVIEVLGPVGQQKVDILSVVRGFGLPDRFGAAALSQAVQLGRQVADSDLKGRRDLTALFTVTIDPVDAKDFDDAISLEREGGRWRLSVHIADVSHYVRPNSDLDSEARERGTSVYLPGTVIPMLPEPLSNGLCSLKPHQVRLTKTVELVYDARGSQLDASVYRSYIRSDHRLNYGQVLDVIEGRDGADGRLVEMLQTCNALAEKLKEVRRHRGMLELSIAKPAVRLDPFGDVAEVLLEESDAAHSLIEEFMLAANEAVAEFLCQRGLPGIFRTHPEPKPEDFAEFAAIARAVGGRVGELSDRKALQRLLDQTRNRPDGHLIHLALLRTMPHALYSEFPGTHFALASSRYLHYTSPIRRYPDLLVHRVLDEHFDGNLKSTKQRQVLGQDFAR